MQVLIIIRTTADSMEVEDMERGVQILLKDQDIFKLIWEWCGLFVQWQHKVKKYMESGPPATNYSFLQMEQRTTSTRRTMLKK